MSKHKWISVANLSLTVQGKTHVLQVVISTDIWTVIALERSQKVFESNVVPPDGIGEHKHAMLGRFESPYDAILAAEHFADEWAKTEELDATVCACGL